MWVTKYVNPERICDQCREDKMDKLLDCRECSITAIKKALLSTDKVEKEYKGDTIIYTYNWRNG